MKKYELKDRWDLLNYLVTRDQLNRKSKTILKSLILYVLKVNKNNNYIIYKLNNKNIIIESALNELTDLYVLTISELIENNLLYENEV